MRRLSTFFSGTAALLLCSFTAQSELIHRYTFDVDASDSAGTADGTLAGGAFISDGGVVLDAALQSYVQLPAEILGEAEAVTIEAWVNFGVSGNWARLFDFGDQNTETGEGRNYILFTPHSGDNDTRMSISDADPGYANENILIVPGNLDNQNVHLVAVFDPTNDSMRMYLDGELAGYRNAPTIPLSSVNDLLNYIGRSLYNSDAYLNAQINEFRIYDHAFSAWQASESSTQGMDSYTPRTTPPPDSIALAVPSEIYLGNVEAPGLMATYGTTTVNIEGEPGITFESSDTSIISFNEAGALVANALGTANITVTFQGQEIVMPVQVSPVPVPEAVLQHRYPFNEPSTALMAEDVVGDADGTLVGFAFFDDAGQVELIPDPVFGDGYVDLPNGIISALDNATFEMWVTFDGEEGIWQRIFDFGNSDEGEDIQGLGTTYLFFTPRTGSAGPWRFEVKTPETPPHFVEGPGTLPPGVEHHVAITYNALGDVSKVYIDGVLMAEGIAPISLQDIQDVNNWLGRSQFEDPGFDGKFDEFRIYEGVLTELQVAVNQAAGPENVGVEPGTLQGLSIDVAPELDVAGLGGTARVLADFAEIQDVNIVSVPGLTFTSSDEDVLTVGPGGVITPAGEGTATLTAQYGGQEATAQVTVATQPAELELLHRYSFSEAPGSFAVEDTAGEADGFVVGDATFTGTGQVDLSGGPASSTTAGYVDLPNGMISALPDAVTFETWSTWDGGAVWQRVYDFGNNNAGEGVQGTGDRTFFLTPQADGVNVVRAAFRPQLDQPEEPVLNGEAPLPTGTEVHVAVVYDAATGVSRLYVDGVRVDTQPVTHPFSSWQGFDVNNWLGRSNWPDPFFDGQLNEFRIWSGAMNDNQVAARFAAGPDSLEEPTEAPELTVTEDEGTLTISWPSTATGYQLEQTTALGPDANWTDVTEPVNSGGGMNSVTIPTTGDMRFFRLAR